MERCRQLYSKGRYQEAIPIIKEELAIREKILGPEHPDVASSLNSLVSLYTNVGDYAKAEPIYQRSFTIWEKAFGKEHLAVAISLDNISEPRSKKGLLYSN